MKKLEYKIVELSGIRNEDETLLNSLGEEGWELASVTEVYALGTSYVGGGKAGITAYLKRVKV